MNKKSDAQLLLGQKEPFLADHQNVAEVAVKVGFTADEIEELRRLYPEKSGKTDERSQGPQK